MLRLVFVAVLLLVCDPAVAGECYTVAKTYERIDGLIAKNGGMRETLNGKEAQDYLDVINEIPPVTSMASRRIVLWEREAMIAFGIQRADGMVCAVGHVSPKIHERALLAARGEPV